MKIKKWQLSFIFISMIISFSFSFEKKTDGVIIELKKEQKTDPALMKIQICKDDIIRIIAVPEKSFSTRQSLMVSKTNWKPVQWSLNEQNNQLILSTSKLKIQVNKHKGTIVFYDRNGKLILQEKAEGSKIITAAEVMGEKSYHIQQLFHSP